ncbi:MAG: hypothetical protein WDN27_01370 [Candidatus Saccharibacteria bacterium]
MVQSRGYHPSRRCDSDRPTKHGLQPNVDARAAVAAVLGQPQAKVPPKPPESESSPKPDDRKERTDRALAGVVMLVLEGQALPLEVAPHSEDQDTQREVLLRANAGFSKVDEETGSSRRGCSGT